MPPDNQALTLKKVYPGKDGKTTLVCDNCGRAKPFEVAKFQRQKSLKIRCKCGAVFYVALEIRRFYRKSTNLSGQYAMFKPGESREIARDAVVVEDVSRSGIRIRTLQAHALKIGDAITIRFVLNNAPQSEITQEALVKNIDGYRIGAEFTDQDVFSDDNRILGFYLMM